MAKVKTSISLSQTGAKLLRDMSDRLGVTATAVVEMALRQLKPLVMRKDGGK